MSRILYLSVLLVARAGCGGDAAPPPGPPASAAQVRVGFGGLVDTIDIAAVGRLRLGAPELVTPDGTTTPSGPIAVDDTPHSAMGQWAANNTWKDPVTGDN